MIGLCRGLARKAFLEHATHMENWQYWKEHRRFGMVPREDVVASCIYPVSRRYYQLLDACPLRMSTPDQPGDGNG